MTGYRFTPHASHGLRRVLADVEERFGALVAQRVLLRLIHAFEMLSERPGLGRARPDITSEPRARFWTVGPTLIAYREANEHIEILFVERGERDLRGFLRRVDPAYPPRDS